MLSHCVNLTASAVGAPSLLYFSLSFLLQFWCVQHGSHTTATARLSVVVSCEMQYLHRCFSWAESRVQQAVHAHPADLLPILCFYNQVPPHMTLLLHLHFTKIKCSVDLVLIVRMITRHVYYLLSTLNSLIFGVQSSTLPLQRLFLPLSESTSTLAPTDCLYCIIYWTRRRALSRWIQPKCINISVSAGP